jgi:hypothetical protein
LVTDGRSSEAGGRPRFFVPYGSARPPTCILWKRPQHNQTLAMSNSHPPSSAKLIHDAFQQAYDGVRILREAKLVQPCLVVLYSTIDAASWLAANHDGDVTKKDFISWVDRFLLPESALECSAIDLYAARCGALHSLSAHSSLQRKGQARLVCYAWGTASASDLHNVLTDLRAKDFVAVHLDSLANALFKGWERYLASLGSHPKAVQRLSHRASFLFSSLGPEPVKRVLDEVRDANG